MLTIQLLPAREGDAIWIKWGDEHSPHQMLVDMGTEAIGKRIRQDLEALPIRQREFDLLVVTHVDRDHIGGVLTGLAEATPLEGLAINDVWFNGYSHLSGGSVGAQASRVETMGPAQGERLSAWLRTQAWNKAFDGGPVQRVAGEPLQVITLHDNLTLTVLGPTPERLHSFIETWEEDVAAALESGHLTEVSPGLESMGPKIPPILETSDDLAFLAESDNQEDKSHANGSSIALLLEYRGKKIVLGGDAFPSDLVEAFAQLSGGEPLKIDAFKLPHHGSKNNVMDSLVKSVECRHWLFSTDGNRFRHPDPVAIARVIHYCDPKPPLLSFNTPSKYNGWWNNDEWKTLYQYTTEYGDAELGLTLGFDV